MQAARITSVETLLVDLPSIRPHQLSMATMDGQTLMLVRLRASDGIEGVGEGTTIGGLAYGAESPETMKVAIDTYITPLLLDADANRVAAIMANVARAVHDNHFAKCAVETALLDALGKRCALPVSELLGGRIHDRLPVAWTLASGNTAQDIAEAEDMLARRRHNIFKLKIGRGDWRKNMAHVAAIKQALGERASIRVDVNQAWSEVTAARAIAQLQDIGVDLVEQPIAAANRKGMARLAAGARLAIMADEALHGPESAYDLASHAAADVFALKIAQSGGLFAAVHVANVAQAAGIGLYGGTMLEGAVGTAASAHLCATLPILEWGTELFGPLLLTEEILRTPLEYGDFSLKVPTGHGLGIELDEAAIARLRRDGLRRRAAPRTPARTGT